jgi:hypothetical protein
MTNPDFRALCAELEDAYTWCIEEYMTAPAEEDTLIQRARAALAQPAPAPTDEDLEDLAEVMNVSGNPVPAMRRALELWGNSQGILDSPPQAEPVAPTDEEIAQFVAEWWENMHGFAPHGDKTVYTVFEFVAREHFADFTRDVLARWGTPANNTRGTH